MTQESDPVHQPEPTGQPEQTGQPEPTAQSESSELPVAGTQNASAEHPGSMPTSTPAIPPDNLRLGTEGKRTHPLSGLVLGLLWGAGVAVAFALPNLRNDEWLFTVLSLPV